MIHGEQDSKRPPSLVSKLSPTVPAFVPGVNYSGPPSTASSNHVVVASALSPHVPEFYPSQFHSQNVPPLPIDSHTLGHRHDGTTTEEKSIQYQARLEESLKKTKSKGPKNDKLYGNDNIEESNTGCIKSSSPRTQYSYSNHRKFCKLNSKREKKESSEDSKLQKNKNEFQKGYSAGGEDVTGDGSKGNENVDNGVGDAERVQEVQGTSILHQNCTAGRKEPNDNKRSLLTEKMEPKNSSSAEELDRRPYTVPTFVVSYSDKVKCLASANSMQNDKHSVDTHKSWIKDFSPNSSSDVKNRCVEGNHNCNGRKHFTAFTQSSKGGTHTTRAERSCGYCSTKQTRTGKSKQDESVVSCSTDKAPSEISGRRSSSFHSFKKLSCDDDTNWRQKKEHSDVSQIRELSKTKHLRTTGSRECTGNTNLMIKSNLQQDSKKPETQVDSKNVNLSLCSAVVEGKKPVHNQHHLSKAGSNSVGNTSILVDNDMRHDHRTYKSWLEPATEVKLSSVVTNESEEFPWDFPDLKESIVLKSSLENKPKAGSEEETEELFSQRHQETMPLMSYSAVLKSAPRLKPVLENPVQKDLISAKKGGLLNVSPQMKSEAENEGNQQEGEGNKKKKKKKKKKNQETKERTQEGGSSKRTERRIALDLGEMLQTITDCTPETKQRSKKLVVAIGVLPSQLAVASPTKTKPNMKVSSLKKGEKQIPHNKLDSTAPVVKRGKERETPARKKPSALKKIILKEREEKKKAREPTEDSSNLVDNEACAIEMGKDICPKEVDENDTGGNEEPQPLDQRVAAEIHSRRFREYCSQVPDKEVDAVATELLKELVRFQDRQFHKDPIKAKAKRRFVLGLREVAKHLKLRKLKCIIISSNVERIKSAGGLDDTLNSIITLCQENKVPLVFALKRQVLGKVLCKKVPVSIVGIFNYDGAQEHFKNLIELTEKARQLYTDKWQETLEKLESMEKEATHNRACKETGEGEMSAQDTLICDTTENKLKTLDGLYSVGETGDDNEVTENGDFSSSDDSGNEGNDDHCADKHIQVVIDDLEIENIE